MTAPKFSLVPAEIPAQGASGLYEAVVKEFINSDLVTARVEIAGKKTNTIAVGLAKCIKDNRIQGVKAVSRQDGAYLKRV